MRDGSAESIIVCVPDRRMATSVSVELYEDGVRLIELYGGLGSAAATEILEATGSKFRSALSALICESPLEGRIRAVDVIQVKSV